MSNWPDPAHPGVPLNPEQDGWHWIQESDLDPECVFWRSQPYFGDKRGRWEANGTEDDFAPYEISTWRYFGPVVTPEETAAQSARIAELKALAYGLMIAMSASGDDFVDILKEARAVLGGKDE